MEHLPIKLCQRIFVYLDLYDLRSLALISKRLAFMVRSFEIDELVVHNVWEQRRMKGNWFYLDQPINFLRMVSEHELGLLFAPKGLITVDQLKRLKLDSFNDWPQRFTPEDIGRFDALEILDIDLDNLSYSKTATTHRLFLPKLIALRVRTFQTHHVHFVAPRLKALDLCTYHTASLVFSHPLSVVHLETYAFNRDLAVFANIRYLEFYGVPTKEIVDTFPKLQTLRIESRSSLAAILEQSNDRERIAHGQQLTVYQFGVQLRYGNELDAELLTDYLRYYNLYLNRLPFYLRNYNLLTKTVRYAEHLDYNLLRDWILEHHNDIIRFYEFYQKFNDIRAITVTKAVDDSLNLIMLIYNSPNLCQLRLTDSRLDQRFYDLLPEISSLFSLQVLEDQYVGLRFEFVGRMKLLQTFRTNQDLVLTDHFQLDTLKHLRQFDFRINDRALTIHVHRKDPDAKYVVRLSNWAALTQKRTFDELLQWSQHFRNRDQDVIVNEYRSVNRTSNRQRASRKYRCTLV